MFPTQSTWMKLNRNPVCSTRYIAEQNSQSKNSDSIVSIKGTMDIGNASSWNLNCSNEQPSHFFQTGMDSVLNGQLLTVSATSGSKSVQHPSAYQPLMSSSNSDNWLNFDACRSTIETRKDGRVIDNEPLNEDTQNYLLIRDFKTLMEIEVPCTNPDSKSKNNSCVFYKKRRKRKTVVKVKDVKYWERRQKNNLAAKKSRDTKREKDQTKGQRLNCLEIENRRLRLELSCLLEQNKNFKQIIGLF